MPDTVVDAFGVVRMTCLPLDSRASFLAFSVVYNSDTRASSQTDSWPSASVATF